MNPEELLKNSESQMQRAVDALKNELTKVRTGRASPQLVDSIKVDYYGTPTPLKQVAQVAVPDAKTLQITCWDQSAIALVERAIIAANIGLTPNVDGKIIRLNVPPLSEERRKDIAKQVKKHGEDCKISIRAARKEANDEVKQEKKTLSEDDSKRHQESVQKLTDRYVAETDKIIDAKVSDILTL